VLISSETATLGFRRSFGMEYRFVGNRFHGDIVNGRRRVIGAEMGSLTHGPEIGEEKKLLCGRGGSREGCDSQFALHSRQLRCKAE